MYSTVEVSSVQRIYRSLIIWSEMSRFWESFIVQVLTSNRKSSPIDPSEDRDFLSYCRTAFLDFKLSKLLVKLKNDHGNAGGSSNYPSHIQTHNQCNILSKQSSYRQSNTSGARQNLCLDDSILGYTVLHFVNIFTFTEANRIELH